MSTSSSNHHQPHDHLSLALSLLTNLQNHPTPAALWIRASIAANYGKLHHHISPEFQSLHISAHQDIKSTHGWYFRLLYFQKRGGGGWVDGSGSNEAELQFDAWIILTTENFHRISVRFPYSFSDWLGFCITCYFVCGCVTGAFKLNIMIKLLATKLMLPKLFKM